MLKRWLSTKELLDTTPALAEMAEAEKLVIKGSPALSELRSVFGALSHKPPAPSRGEEDAAKEAESQKKAYVAEELPSSPVYDKKTGVLLIPSKRFDGSTEDPPWNMPEPILWDWLRTVTIDRVEESGLSGVNGCLWARYLNFDGQQRSGLLKFGGASNDHAMRHWGVEYGLDGQYDFLKREQASCEVMKALGCEDLAPPSAVREVLTASLVPDSTRMAIGRNLKISPKKVNDRLGVNALLQAVPLNAENFAEYWAKLGPDDTNRWERASSRLRHSIYRSILLDFFLGVPNRLLCDHMYNRSSDSLALYGFEVSFPHPGATAEWYMQMRKRCWGRRFSGPLEEPPPGTPASGVDSMGMMGTFTDREREEMTMTAKQMADGFDEATATLLVQVLTEIGIPASNIADTVSKIVFLENNAEDIVSNSFDYVRDVLVPLRRGYGDGDARIGMILQTTSQIMTTALGKNFDFSKTIKEKVPDGTEFTI
jgi:hypothetical protein